MRCLRMHDHFPSVFKMIALIENMPERTSEENHSNSGWREGLADDPP